MYERVANAVIHNPGYGTALPSSPVDMSEFVLVDSLTAPTYSWRLKYVAAKASNKWVFIGGAAVFAAVETSQTTNSTSYIDLATAGPSIALPVAGDYDVEVGCRVRSNLGALTYPRMSYAIGGTAAVDADSPSLYISGTNDNAGMLYLKRRKTGLTAVTLTAKYKVSATTTEFQQRWIAATPIALGG